MSARELVERLERQGITVEIDGDDKLAVEGRDDRVGAEIETIRQNKPAIITYLKSRRSEQASRILNLPPRKEAGDEPAATRDPDAGRSAPPPQAPKPLPQRLGALSVEGMRPAPAGKSQSRALAKRASWQPEIKARFSNFASAGRAAARGVVAAAAASVPAPRARWAAPPVGLQPADSPAKIIPDALPYQSDLTEIIEEPPPRHMRATTYILVTFLSLAVIISAVVEIDIIIRGTGKLTVDGPPLVLQPIERAILRKLHVKPGDIVRKGEVLATLDPTFAEADVTAIETQQRMTAAQLRRLEAEVKEEPFLPEPGSVEEKLQAEIFLQRRQELQSRLRSYDEDVKRAQAAVRTLEVEKTLLQQQFVVARDVEQMRATLLERQSGSRLQFLEAQTMRIRAERDHQGANDRLVELRHDFQSKLAARQAFVEEWRRRLFEEIERLRSEATRVDGAQAKARRMKELVVIAAPEDGVVIDIAKRSVGSVLKEAETLIMLAPTNMPLIAEISLASADIGYAKTGDDVVVKVDSFPYTRHGALSGTLRSISQESFAPGATEAGTAAGPQSGESFHRAQVVLTEMKLDRLPEGAALIPGMTISADIKVGTRTVISYFLTPLVRGFDEGLREP